MGVLYSKGGCGTIYWAYKIRVGYGYRGIIRLCTI